MKNMSSGERIVRIAIGVVIIGWGLFTKNWWGAIGVLPLLTGVIGWCGLYQVLGKCCSFSKNKAEQGSNCCSKQEKPKSGGCCGGQ